MKKWYIIMIIYTKRKLHVTWYIIMIIFTKRKVHATWCDIKEKNIENIHIELHKVFNEC